MRRAITLAGLALSLFSFPALTQQAAANGSIEGIVVRADTEQPLANAQVTLIQISGLATPPAGTAGADGGTVALGAVIALNGIAGVIAQVITGADGKFTFKDLRPESYRLAATATGFVRQEYEQRALYGQGRMLYLSAGQEFKDATVRLTPAGTVSGHVYDEGGQPATGAQVQLLRAVFTFQGNRAYSSSGIAVADDRGAYRVYGVMPGRYHLVAGTPLGVAALRGVTGVGAAGPTSPHFSVVYYPDSADFEHASDVEVTAGGEVSLDIRVTRQVRTFRVKGRVVDGTGAGIPANLNIMLGWQSYNSSGSTAGARIIDAATGSFEIQNVPPGEYSVLAQLPPTPLGGPRGGAVSAVDIAAQLAERASQPSASAPIRIVDSDIEGLVLTLNTGAVVNGRIVVDGKPLSSVPNLERLRITLNSPDFSAGILPIPGTVPGATAIAADGTFKLKGMREGEYRFQLNVPGFFVASVKYGKDEILGKLFKYSGSASGAIEVTLRASTATVTGTVTDVKMQPVSGVNVVFAPVDASRLELFRTVPTDQNGRYSMSNLSPGEYRAFSWESIESYAYFDPDFLKQYEQFGKAVSITEPSDSRVDVKLIPAQ